MGRPKGSKNKTTVVKTKESPVVQKKQTTLKLSLPDVPKQQRDDVAVTTDFIRAVTELAVIAGRNFYLSKLQPWIDTFKDQNSLRIEIEEDEKLGVDTFSLYSGSTDEDDGDAVCLDTRHVFRADIDDVVRGVLGAR